MSQQLITAQHKFQNVLTNLTQTPSNSQHICIMAAGLEFQQATEYCDQHNINYIAIKRSQSEGLSIKIEDYHVIIFEVALYQNTYHEYIGSCLTEQFTDFVLFYLQKDCPMLQVKGRAIRQRSHNDYSHDEPRKISVFLIPLKVDDNHI